MALLYSPHNLNMEVKNMRIELSVVFDIMNKLAEGKGKFLNCTDFEPHDRVLVSNSMAHLLRSGMIDGDLTETFHNGVGEIYSVSSDILTATGLNMLELIKVPTLWEEATSYKAGFQTVLELYVWLNAKHRGTRSRTYFT